MKRKVSFEILLDGDLSEGQLSSFDNSVLSSLVISSDEQGNVLFTIYSGDNPILLGQETAAAVRNMIAELINNERTTPTV